MEFLLSAVLGELTTRSINFFISRKSKPQALDVEDRLCSVLLRSQVIIDEANGRHIANQVVLEQLEGLRDTMYRSCYTLDTFRYQPHDKEYAEDQAVSHSSCLSKLNYLKGFCSSSRNTQILEQLQKALDDLSSVILDVEGLVIFLSSYPRLYRQPYSMHLLLDNCMFGRRMEVQLVINFLLHTQPHGAEELEVLPIVGPGSVGKSTLLAHVCKDERVCDYFSEIVFLSDHNFRDEKLTTIGKRCEMKYQNSTSSNGGRMLIVFDVAGDFDEDRWRRLYSASKRCVTSGGKIIIASRSDKVKNLGTTQAVTLKYMSHEEYWYFFKTLAFGSLDPEMHPRLAHVAMEIARTLNGTFIAASFVARLLRDNFDIHFWCKVLAFYRRFIQKHLSEFGDHPFDRMNQNRLAQLGRMDAPSEDLLVYHQCQCSAQDEVPKIRMQDVMFGSVKCHGKFEVLGWKSPMPPYYNYVYVCEIRELKPRAGKRKRSTKKEVTLC